MIGGLLAGAAAGRCRAEAAGLPAAIGRIEAACGGRLGIAVLDTGRGWCSGYRQAELFPMCSTFKAMLAAAVLRAADRGEEMLGRAVPVPPGAILPYSPVTSARAGGGMSVAELCAATVMTSDNTAANLLLAGIGGPAGYTRFLRKIGDPVTRLDRTELDLNESRPGDPRDTTTPEAMAADLQAVLLGPVLTPASRGLLTGWMTGCRTGLARLRAGLPAAWSVANKTGTGDHGSTNDIAVVWPAGRAPVVITAYLTQCAAPLDQREAALAAVGRAVSAALPR